MMPSHGIMVHGWLPEMGAIEVVNPAGNCCAGMHALKYAYMAVKTGEVHKAVAAVQNALRGFSDQAPLKMRPNNWQHWRKTLFSLLKRIFCDGCYRMAPGHSCYRIKRMTRE